jgi:hypothetical protein
LKRTRADVHRFASVCVAPPGYFEHSVQRDGVWIRAASSRRSMRSTA